MSQEDIKSDEISQEAFGSNLELTGTCEGPGLECPFCHEVVEDIANLCEHVISHEGQDRCFHCPVCQLWSFNTMHLRTHLNDQALQQAELYPAEELEPVTCPICSNCFISREQLLSHMNQSHSNQIHPCPKCGKIIKGQNTLMIHLREHSGLVDENEVTCTICGRSIPQSRYQDHVNYHKKKQKCHICYEYVRISEMTSHLRNHAEFVPIKCSIDLCDRTFLSEKRLQRHLSETHRDKSYPCPECGKIFRQPHSMKNHLLLHVGVNSFVCDVCGQGFPNQPKLSLHKRSHEDRTTWHQCPKCPKIYKYRNFLERHMQSHETQIVAHGLDDCKLKCVYCEETCETEAVLQGHIQKHWEEDKNQSCPQCGVSFEGVPELLKHCKTAHVVQCPYCLQFKTDKQEMIEHLRCHEVKPTGYSCQKCSQTFYSGEILLEHAKTHEKKFQCEVCGKNFPERYRLKKHQVIHLPLDKRPEKCPNCDKSFYTKQALKTHIYANHTDNIPIYECTECGKTFKFKKPYDNHLITHSGHTPYSCDICGRQYALRNQLTVHKSNAHRSPTKCAYCPKMFNDRSYQREHERTHENPQVWKCSICERQYNTQRLLKFHEKSHLSKERAECPICKKTFGREDYMRFHFTAEHREGGGYNCPVCNKRFVRKDHLKTHSTLHSGEKPYKCQFCPHACRYKGNLMKHLKSHDNEKKEQVTDET